MFAAPGVNASKSALTLYSCEIEWRRSCGMGRCISWLLVTDI
jgi:hypothetical protein